jgi:DNA polymerase-3 subunit epsilon
MPGRHREPTRTRALSEPTGLDRDLVCLDLETTGGNPAWHRIIEIGAVQIDRDGVSREWSTLVNPGTRIPPAITAFTGITEQMVAHAPAFEDVHRELLSRLAGRVFVAHNARFDYGFIRAELARLDRRWSAPVLCTVKLSRRLYPREPRHNLDAVIARHGLECTARHRALGDARVLCDLLAVLRRAIDPKRLADVVETLLHHAPLPPQLPPDLADELPETAGVYRFYGEDGTLLYVGKSRNLRGRVLEHFATGHHSGAGQRLAREVRKVTWSETAGELGALLAEAHAVKTLRPLHNRRLRAGAAAWTLRLEPRPGAPHRVVAVELEALDAADQQELYGFFRDRRAAMRTLEEIVRAHQLCARVLGLERGAGVDADGGSCFAYQLQRCRGACVGQESAALHDTRLRLALASQRLKAWPYRGRVLVAERDWRGSEDLHVIAAWRHLGTVHEAAAAAELHVDSVPFDPDVYRILKRFLRDPGAARIVELD